MTNAANGIDPDAEPQADPELDLDLDDLSVYDSSYEYDDMQDEDAYYPDDSGSKKKTVTIVIISLIVVLALAIGGGIWYFMDMTADDGLIYSNVYAAGVNLGGMTPDQAKTALHEATDGTYTQLSLTVNLPDTQLVLAPADTGASLNVDTLVDAAYGYGRDGNRWENYLARSEAAASNYEVSLLDYMTLNTDYIRQNVDQLAQAAESTLTQSTVTVTGEVPALDRTIAEATADETVEHMTMTIVKGTPERHLDADGLYNAILNAYSTNDFTEITMEYNVIEPDAIDLEALSQQHCVEPVDAILDEETYEVTPEVLGYGFILEELQTQLDEAEYGAEILCTFQFIDPEVTVLSLDEYMFQDELASYSSNHTNIANRTNNLVLACKAIDGTIIRPGEVFSFNDIVGERTAAKGYKSATVYTAGKSEPQLGGGICQVASTIYYCTLVADLEIVERGPHQFMVDYVPRGMDATIYWGSKDFKFRNNTDYPIRIDASTHDGQCHISLYGTDDKDYYVEMTYKTVSGPTGGGTEYKEFSADNNPNGYKDGEVIQTAYSGYVIETYKNKYNKETKELISTELEATSKFNSRPKIIAKMVGSTDETEPTTTAPSSTTAPTTSTEPPATTPTAPPTTEPPATQPPATEPPATQPPATEPPATQPPATEPPTA